MTANYLKFGPHAAGVGGVYTGLDQYITSCRDAGVPCIVQAVDNAGPAQAVQALNRDRDVIVYRMTSRNGVSLDTADYSANPVTFAQARMAAIAQHWPPELNRARVWTVPVNEPSKEPGDVQWLAAFTLECARISVANGWRHLAYGWSMGTPEVDFWELPDVLAYLRLCAQYPHLLGVSLHEYGGDDNIMDNYPYLIGRFEFLHDVCDDHDIPRPKIVIGEFGWREASLRPSPGSFRTQLEWAQMAYGYSGYGNILGAAIWTLGNWHGTVAADLAGHMPTLTAMAAEYDYTPPVDPPPPPTTKHKAIVVKLPQAATKTEWLAACGIGYDFRHTVTASHDDMMIILYNGNGESFVKFADPVKDAEAVRLVEAAGYRWERLTPKPITPPPGGAIDLSRFMVADPLCWRVVRHPNGSQEDIQDMQLGGGLWVRRKNSLGEWWRIADGFAWLIHDTSPAPGSQGVERVYTCYKSGLPGAPKNPLAMTIGQTWQESAAHHVQFKAKQGCADLAENSGAATNTAVVTRHEVGYTFNTYGQGLRFDEVVWIKTGVETQIYGRHSGKSAGWIGWEAPWGKSEPVEVYWNRPAMTTEPPRYCGW